MSLKPGEQQALSAIETGLRTSDGRYVRMLERLAKRLPRPQGPGRPSRWRRFTWRQRGVRVTLLAIIATLLVAGAVAGAVIGAHGGHAAPPRGRAGVAGMTTPAGAMLFQG